MSNNKKQQKDEDDQVDTFFYAAGVFIWLVLMIWGLS
jgi:hypothetical protein